MKITLTDGGIETRIIMNYELPILRNGSPQHLKLWRNKRCRKRDRIKLGQGGVF